MDSHQTDKSYLRYFSENKNRLVSNSVVKFKTLRQFHDPVGYKTILPIKRNIQSSMTCFSKQIFTTSVNLKLINLNFHSVFKNRVSIIWSSIHICTTYSG